MGYWVKRKLHDLNNMKGLRARAKFHRRSARPFKQPGQASHIILGETRKRNTGASIWAVYIFAPSLTQRRAAEKLSVFVQIFRSTALPNISHRRAEERSGGGRGGGGRREPLTSSGKTSKNTKHHVQSQGQTETSWGEGPGVAGLGGGGVSAVVSVQQQQCGKQKLLKRHFVCCTYGP